MAIYRDGGTTVAHQKRKLRKLLPFIVVIVLLLIAIGAGWWYINRTTQASEPVSTKTIDKGFFDPLKLYETDYFSFRSTDGWQLIETESKPPQKFVYRLLLNNLSVEQELQIYVNQKADDERVTFVVPVTRLDNTLQPASNQSDHCRTFLPKNPPADNPITLQYASSSFSCWRDNTLTIVGASEVNGDSYITMPRRDGTSADYFIYYRDSRFTNVTGDFKNILASFTSR